MVALGKMLVAFLVITSNMELVSSGEYNSIIFSMESFVPNTSASTPKMQTKTFFQMTQLPGPKPLSQYVTNSMTTYGRNRNKNDQ